MARWTPIQLWKLVFYPWWPLDSTSLHGRNLTKSGVQLVLRVVCPESLRSPKMLPQRRKYLKMLQLACLLEESKQIGSPCPSCPPSSLAARSLAAVLARTAQILRACCWGYLSLGSGHTAPFYILWNSVKLVSAWLLQYCYFWLMLTNTWLITNCE